MADALPIPPDPPAPAFANGVRVHGNPLEAILIFYHLGPTDTGRSPTIHFVTTVALSRAGAENLLQQLQTVMPSLGSPPAGMEGISLDDPPTPPTGRLE